MSTTSDGTINARERLVRAAQSLYAERGVAASTPQQVLARSGVGQGSLYHHFPTKRDLARVAVERTVHELLESSEATLATDAPPRERLAAYLSRDRDAVAGCRVGRLTSDPMVMSEPELGELVKGYFTDLLALVGDVLRESGLQEDAVRQRAAVIVAVVQGGYVLARATADPELMRNAVQGAVSLLDGAGDNVES